MPRSILMLATLLWLALVNLAIGPASAQTSPAVRLTHQQAAEHLIAAQHDWPRYLSRMLIQRDLMNRDIQRLQLMCFYQAPHVLRVHAAITLVNHVWFFQLLGESPPSVRDVLAATTPRNAARLERTYRKLIRRLVIYEAFYQELYRNQLWSATLVVKTPDGGCT